MCALLVKSFVMSVSARCIYRFVCTIALQTIHEIEIGTLKGGDESEPEFSSSSEPEL